MIVTNLLLLILAVLLLILITRMGHIMAAIDDLGTAVTGLEAEVQTVIADIATLKASGGTPDSAITPITDRVNAATAALKAGE